MEDTIGDQLINETITLNNKYRNLLEICFKDPSEDNWDKAYIANQAWVEAVNKLKKHNFSFLIKISDQFRF